MPKKDKVVVPPTNKNNIVRHQQGGLRVLTETGKSWNPKQLAYMMMLADIGNEKSDPEMAEELGVSRQTLWNWRQLPGFLDDAEHLLDKMLKSQMAHVYRGLMKRAKQGEVDQAKLLLAQAGRLKEAQQADKHIHLHKHFGNEKEEFGIV